MMRARRHIDIINKTSEGYVCIALDAHNKGSHQRDLELEKKIKEGCQCALVELLNNSIE